MKKRILAMLLSVIMLIGILPISAMAADIVASGKCGSNLTWKIDEYGTLAITGSGEMYDYDECYELWYAEYWHQVDRIEIGSGVTKVNLEAFAIFWMLREFEVEEDNRYYSNDYFGVLFNKDKTELLRIPSYIMPTTYVIPDSVTKIADHAVWNCEIRELIIPASVEVMAEPVFSGCLSMTDIIVAEDNANFSNCENGALYNKDKTELIYKPGGITGVFTIPASVTRIADIALHDSSNMGALRFVGNPPAFDGEDFIFLRFVAFYPENNPKWTEDVLESFGADYWIPCDSSVPESELCMTGICGDEVTWKYTFDKTLTFSGKGAMWDGAYAVDGMFTETNTHTVVIEEGITRIGAYAFDTYKQLQNVYIPASVTEIGKGAFDNCGSMEKFVVADNNPNYSSDDSGVLFNKDKSVLIEAPSQLGDYAIPDGVETVKAIAFDSLQNLTELTIPASVTNIEENAFYECYMLEKFTVAEENESYSSDAKGLLYNKDKSELVKVPEGIEGNYVIPASVERFNSYACTELFGFGEAIKFEGNAPTIEENAFYDISATVYYPEDNDTWTDDVMQNYGGELEWIVYNANNLDALTYSGTYGDSFTWKLSFDGVLTISGEGMFELPTEPAPWTGLEDKIYHVVFEEGITGIDEYSGGPEYYGFEILWNLKTISISASMMELPIYSDIGAAAFNGSGSLEKIIVDEDNPKYSSDEYGVLFNKDKTTLWMMPTSCVNGSYAIPEGVTSVYHWAFYGNYGVTEIIIPESLESVGYYSLGACNNLEKFVVDEDNEYFSSDVQGVLYNKDKSDIEFVPTAMKSTLVIPSSVKSIEWDAFTYDLLSYDHLEKIVFEGDAPDYIAGLYYVTIYYPKNNPTWNDEVKKIIGSRNTWIAYNLQGDVDSNGEVSNADLVMVARYIVELYDENTVADIEKYGDMNGDGLVNNNDLVSIARIIVGLD